MASAITDRIGKRIEAQLAFDDSSRLFNLRFPAMGTNCRALFHSNSRQAATDFSLATTQWVADFETKYSRFRDDSMISGINRLAGICEMEIDLEASHIFDLCGELFFASGGLLDATALPVMELWNLGSPPYRIPDDNEIAEALDLVGWGKVERSSNGIYLPITGMKLDIGGFGKEFAVDRVSEIAVQLGIESFLIDFGRDIRLGEPPPRLDFWNVGIADPANPHQSNGTLHLHSKAVATSGNYIRNFEHEGKTYGHIIDPRSGRPIARSTLTATVIANTCIEAGRLSTTACILGLEEGLESIESSYASEGTISYNNKLLTTSGFYEYAQIN